MAAPCCYCHIIDYAIRMMHNELKIKLLHQHGLHSLNVTRGNFGMRGQRGKVLLDTRGNNPDDHRIAQLWHFIYLDSETKARNSQNREWLPQLLRCATKSVHKYTSCANDTIETESVKNLRFGKLQWFDNGSKKVKDRAAIARGYAERQVWRETRKIWQPKPSDTLAACKREHQLRTKMSCWSGWLQNLRRDF
jgi:hypothetical protein